LRPRDPGGGDRLVAKLDGAVVEGLDPVAEAGRLQHVARQGEGVDDVDLGPGVGVVPVHLAQNLRVRVQGGGAPGLVVHGHAAPLQLGAHGPVEQNDLAAGNTIHQLHDPSRLSVTRRGQGAGGRLWRSG
jgi:hypothetical protein